MKYPKSSDAAGTSWRHTATQPFRPYPNSQRGQEKTELHGLSIPDPYRWLEQSDDKKTQAWVAQQNQYTQAYLEAHAKTVRAQLQQRYKKYVSFIKHSLPSVRGDYHFELRRLPGYEQPLLIVEEGNDFQLLFDPTQENAEGHAQILDFEPSHNGAWVAVQWAVAGSDHRHWGIVETSTGQRVYTGAETLRFTNFCWDEHGVYFMVWDNESTCRLQYLTVENGAFDVQTAFTCTDLKWDYCQLSVAPSGQYILIEAFQGTLGNTLWCWDKNSTEATCLESTVKGFTEVVGFFQQEVYLRSNKTALNFSLQARHLETGQTREILAEQEKAVLERVIPLSKGFVACYQEEAVHRLIHFDWDGQVGRPIDLPPFTAISGVAVVPDSDAFYLTLSSFTHPEWVYLYTPYQLQPVATPEIPGFHVPLTVSQEQYVSFDGATVSLFVIHKEGLSRKQPHPCYLYGYGGFGMSMLPSLRLGWLPFLEAGGVVVVAHIRGGSEQGRHWHEAGRGKQKHVVFKDFIAAAEHLIDNKWTTSQQLIIGGRSNGGLLVGSVMTQRPELAAVALPGSGLMDMLRYEQFTVGHFWTDEFGSVANEEDFQQLRTFSPLHNIKPDTHYPATFITTGDKDDRVVPAHSYKFAASLQYHQAGKAPILLRVARQAGHGKGKPMSEMIEEQADQWSFVFSQLGLTLPE